MSRLIKNFHQVMSLDKRFFMFGYARHSTEQQHLRKPQTGMVFRFLTGVESPYYMLARSTERELLLFFYFFVSFFLTFLSFPRLFLYFAISQSCVISFSFLLFQQGRAEILYLYILFVFSGICRPLFGKVEKSSRTNT